ncbi:MAG: NADH-quinone oxidoreductase subunit A, partial [Thermoplasmata archaeon]|nr:NADH-quinone oxidoreductase subunit A [Thermoplasmata archaeon]
YLPVAIIAVIALLLPVVTFVLSGLLRPRKPSELKFTTYECGEEPIGEAQIQFHFQYYMFAIIFVVFDVVAVFLLLWALMFSELPLAENLAVHIAVVIFVITTGVAVVYALKKEKEIHI